MRLAGGQFLLHYTLIEQIGAGRMEVVYRATDAKLRRGVAIKVLTTSPGGDGARLSARHGYRV